VAVIFSLAISLWGTVGWVITGASLAALLVLMTLEMAAGIYLSPPRMRLAYPWRDRIRDKLYALVLVAVSAVLDVLLHSVAVFMPRDMPVLESGVMMITLASIFWFIGEQIWGILANHHEAGGMTAPPHLAIAASGIKYLFQAIAKVDESRYVKSYDGHGPPRESRWIDNLKDMPEEKVADLATLVGTAMESEPPEHAAGKIEAIIEEHIEQQENSR